MYLLVYTIAKERETFGDFRQYPVVAFIVNHGRHWYEPYFE